MTKRELTQASSELAAKKRPWALAVGEGWHLSADIEQAIAPAILDASKPSGDWFDGQLMNCLVLAVFTRNNECYASRFDLGKRIFLDEVPVEVDQKYIDVFINMTRLFSN